jgi:hypothetical protein
VKAFVRRLSWILPLSLLAVFLLLLFLAWGLGPPAPEWVSVLELAFLAPGFAAASLLPGFPGFGLLVLAISLAFYSLLIGGVIFLYLAATRTLGRRDAA